MENKKRNTGLVVTIIILSLCLLGTSGYVVYDKLLFQEESIHKVEETIKNDDIFTSRNTIHKLASNKLLNIDNNFEEVEKIVQYDNMMTPDNEGIYLSINEDKKLILKDDNNNESLIKTLDENVVMLYDSGNGCQAQSFITYILTEEGNIFFFENQNVYLENNIREDILNNIKNNKPSNIPLTKTNHVKILAFTNFIQEINENEETIMCGSLPPIVYTENEELMVFGYKGILEEVNFKTTIK